MYNTWSEPSSWPWGLKGDSTIGFRRLGLHVPNRWCLCRGLISPSFKRQLGSAWRELSLRDLNTVIGRCIYFFVYLHSFSWIICVCSSSLDRYPISEAPHASLVVYRDKWTVAERPVWACAKFTCKIKLPFLRGKRHSSMLGYQYTLLSLHTLVLSRQLSHSTKNRSSIRIVCWLFL